MINSLEDFGWVWSHHVAELHLLVLGESPVVVACDQRLKLSCLQVWHLQNLAIHLK